MIYFLFKQDYYFKQIYLVHFSNLLQSLYIEVMYSTICVSKVPYLHTPLSFQSHYHGFFVCFFFFLTVLELYIY